VLELSANRRKKPVPYYVTVKVTAKADEVTPYFDHPITWAG
jgi:hypothetical protein